MSFRIITLLLSALMACGNFLSLYPERIFIATGEPSGDHLGAWFIKKNNWHNAGNNIKGVCSRELEALGVATLPAFEALRGPIKYRVFFSPQLIKPALYTELKNTIIDFCPDRLILVDSPWVNLTLAKDIKLALPTTQITYIAPPEVWFWGTLARLASHKTLQQFVDEIIVLYPHEQHFYQQQGLRVRWLGYPYAADLGLEEHELVKKQHLIALLPGSRTRELTRLLPIFCAAAARLRARHSKLSFVIPCADETCHAFITRFLTSKQLNFISLCPANDYQLLRTCCAAVAKPGTNTLELALLEVPTIVAAKVGWGYYLMLKIFIRPRCVSLPNLLSGEPLFKELLQTNCTVEKIAAELDFLYTSFLHDDPIYSQKIVASRDFKQRFASPRDNADHERP